MSKAAARHRELFGEFLPQLIHDPNACGSGHYLVGNYKHIMEFVMRGNLKILTVIQGTLDFAYDKKPRRKGRAVLRFEECDYDAVFIDDILQCLDGSARVEHWELDSDPDEKSRRLRAIVIVDGREDCGVLAQRIIPDEAFSDKLDEEDEKKFNELEKEGKLERDDDEIVGDVIDLMSSTFDPNDW